MCTSISKAKYLMGMRGVSAIAGKTKGLQIPGVKDIIAVASGKGGVGKSTTAVNLAAALANRYQLAIGLLDADVYGPSIPTMMKISGKPDVNEDLKMIPKENYGVKCMSMGLLVEKDQPIVWRGPMVMSALEKMAKGVEWGKLDILVVDMPPGTGDAQLTISQRLQLSGAIIVSTPQDIALLDARRGAFMFSKVNVPSIASDDDGLLGDIHLGVHTSGKSSVIRPYNLTHVMDSISEEDSDDAEWVEVSRRGQLSGSDASRIVGVIENMSCFKCPHCDEPSYIFGEGGARRTAEELSLDYLGDIPIEMKNRSCCDEGIPIVISSPESASARGYTNIAQKVITKLKELAQKQFHPEISL